MKQQATIVGDTFRLFRWTDPVVPDQYWTDHYQLLHSRGFALRDYWRPKSSGATPLRLEDMRGHPGNHCCHILARFGDPNDPTTTFIVIPYPHDLPFQPFFYNINEVMEYGRQLLEGIAFLHSRNVAQVFPLLQDQPDFRAIPFKYEHLATFPLSYDVLHHEYLPDGSGRCPHNTRRPKDIFYYFIHLRFAVLKDDCRSTANNMAAAPNISVASGAAADGTEFDAGDHLLLSGHGIDPLVDTSSTSDLLPLNDNDDPPTPPMVRDLQGFVYAFVHFAWDKTASDQRFAFLQEFEEQVLGPDPPNAKQALALWCKIHKSLTLCQRYLWRVRPRVWYA
ncbi:hypothetical protein EIP91_003472 [Steccherinum ochraceum]|uniref:Protein kinase domain-containing protein n=1 Tax=Steccherinum ochraceum TaxID=92696 RepID=A0A4R0RCY8_9APHY|nr:hypothetical protein EIP91_003472 [Steccherinum ochraceum]